MDGRTMPRQPSISVSSSASSQSFSLRDFEIEHLEDEKVYVAVPKEVDQWIENFKWLVKNIPKDKKIVILHVHQPAQRIPTPLGSMNVNKVSEKELQIFRKGEKDEMDKVLKIYSDSCTAQKFSVRTFVNENVDIATGILQIITQLSVTDLIMGAAANKELSWTKKNKAPKSKKAISVQKNADQSCRIHFICKGELICISEGGKNISVSGELSRSNSSASTHPLSIQLSFSSRSQSLFVIDALDSPVSNYSGLESPSQRPKVLVRDIDEQSRASDSFSSSPVDSFIMDDTYTQLKDLHLELENLKREAYEESCRRRKAEMEVLELRRQLRSKENSLRMETTIRNDFEEKFDQERSKVQEHEKMFDVLTKELNDLLGKKKSINCTEFTYSEIEEATNNFNVSNKIGEGGFGTVFRGFLRHTEVAIKIRKQESVQGDKEFNQEVLVLSRIRHPNFVTLIGACQEAKALVYEFLPRGSLEDHLTCKNNTRALPWQARVRIALEVCTALIFLHSTEPNSIAHGDIKPGNILLDSNNVCKLSDFGICRELEHTSTTLTPYHITENPKGSFAYMDPEYLHSAKMTPKYDVFSFGIVILRLVTGTDPKNIRNTVLLAIKEKRLQTIVDPLAGEWPLDEVEKMVVLGLRCSDPVSQNRPNLANDVWNLIKSMVDLTSG